MSAISSINFKKSNAIQTRHNDRDLKPNYLISDSGCECNRTHLQALKLRNQIIKNAIETYNEKKPEKAPKFKAKSYEWSAVCNIKETTTMADLERLAEHFEQKYGFQCYQIAIHRDEGHFDDYGNKVINHHAHLEFVTLDKETGRNMYRREFITPKTLREIQTEVAEILQMERGEDKRNSKRERVEPRKYAQLKEQERKNTRKLKQELEADIKEKDKVIQAKNQELEQEKLSKAELKKELEQLRVNSKNQGYSKEFFQEINLEKKKLRFDNKKELEQWFQNLVEKHTKKGILSNKVDNEAIFEDMYKVYKEPYEKIQDLEAKLKYSKAENTELKNEKERFHELLESDPALKEAYNQALKNLENRKKEKMPDKKRQWLESKERQERILDKRSEQDQENDHDDYEEETQENTQKTPNNLAEQEEISLGNIVKDDKPLFPINSDKTKASEQTQEDNKTKIRKYR